MVAPRPRGTGVAMFRPPSALFMPWCADVIATASSSSVAFPADLLPHVGVLEVECLPELAPHRSDRTVV